jgi:hypothetical protein
MRGCILLDIHSMMCRNLLRSPSGELVPHRPSHTRDYLSSLSTIFELARRVQPLGVRSNGIKIIDSWHTETPSRFLKDNFGTYSASHGGIYPTDASAAATRLTIVSPENQTDPRLGVPKTLEMVPSEMDAFREFAFRRATSLSILSAQSAQRLEVRSHRWSHSFNLVVGDSFEDRLLFWNARLLIPAWLDGDLCCLRIKTEQLNSSEFTSILIDTLNQRNHVNYGSGGPSWLTVRSTSLGATRVGEVTKLLQENSIWGSIASESITNIDQIVPPTDALEGAREARRSFGEFYARRNHTTFN